MSEGTSLEELIMRLMREQNSLRDFDDAIAGHLGWKPAFETTFDQETGKNKTVQLRKWHPPNSDQLRRVPSFTTHLHAALDLARSVAPNEPIGVSWSSDDRAYAKIGDARLVSAFTPMLALCAASLLIVRRKGSTSGN